MFETIKTPEERLARVENMVEEIHGMMRSDRRSRRIGTFFKLVYWAAFAYGMFWVYQNYLIPIIKQSSDALNQIQQMQKNVNDSTSKINAGLKDAQSGVDVSKIQDMLNGILKVAPGTK